MSKKTNSVPEQFLEQLAEKILSDETVAAAFRDFQRTAANLSDAITKKVTMNFVISALNKLPHNALTQRDSESAHAKRKTTEPDWSKSSNESLRHAQIRRKKMGIKISDALNDELVKRFPGYSRETETFGNTPLSKLSDFRLRQIYWRTKKSGAPIDDELSTELARRFPSYNPTTRTFKRGRIAHPETKQRAKRFAQMRDTSLRTILGRYKSSGTEIPSALDAELARRFSNYDTATHSFRRVSHKKAPQTTTPHNANITVTIKPIKTTLDGTYNDIYINGVKFIGNHVDTQIKLLCSNTILAIHGTIVNDPKYPEIPTWMVYDANLRSRIPEYKRKRSQHKIYANGITNTSDGTAILELSNDAKIYLETERMKKIAQMRRFVVDNQK